MKEGFGMIKHKMELVWHSCTDCPPKEDYNELLYVTDGEDVVEVEWKRDGDRQYFFVEYSPLERCDIEVGVNSDGWWWADLQQTVRGFMPLHKN